MLEQRDIDRGTLSALLRLKTRTDQAHLVAPNAVTIAQAAYEPGGHVWGLWDGDRAVGLLAMLDPRSALLEDGDDPDAAIIWRLSINASDQGQGHGRAAIGHAIDVARMWGLPRIATSVVDSATSNIGFYEHLGFRRTGTFVDGEIVLNRAV